MKTNVSLKETSRIEAFSDGVFAIAITLLVLEIKVPESSDLQANFIRALLEKWPNYLAFFIGFFTILVCWINHHYLFNRISIATHRLILANSLTLFAVCSVPYPTAILGQSFQGGDLQTAVQLFGLGYILMSICYRMLSNYVDNDIDVNYSREDRKHKKVVKLMYNLAIIHTIITFLITFISVLAGLFLYILLFSMFLFPAWYARLIMKIQDHRDNADL